MSGSNIAVYGSFEVPGTGPRPENALVYGAPLEPRVHMDTLRNGVLPVHEVAIRVSGYMQTAAGEVGMLDTVALATHMTTEEGYRFASLEGRPTKPLAFAFVRELPPRVSSAHRSGAESTDFVLEQFGVTWQQRGNETVAPQRYRAAANGLLRVITDDMKQLDNIYVVGYPNDSRDSSYFAQYGFQQVSEGVHRVWERNAWGGRQQVLYGARVGYVQQSIRGELPVKQIVAQYPTRQTAPVTVRPAVSA
jgi:hypothetical protein